MQVFELNGKRPRIHRTARLLQGAVVAGNVVIGPEALLSFGCIVYAEQEILEIARGAYIGDVALVHCKGDAIRIGEFVLVGHGAQICAGCVEDFGQVGINAVVLDGACVAESSMLSADSLLMKGIRTTPRSIWAGRPAREEAVFDELDARSKEQRALERLRIFDTLRPLELQEVRFE
jgi:carbonic anhydrase/acetyltransferase-like protein (isoleucine patch superfamily)